MNPRFLPVLVTFASALVAVSAPALADDAATRAAEVLFTEGRDLMRAEKYDEACPKLARSHELAPAVGTLLNLGLCYEKSGRTASAWLRYKEAASIAAQKHDARETYARDRVSSLEIELARLTVDVAPDVAKASPHVVLDGADLPNASWGVAIPIDPGDHVVVATASEDRTVTKRTHIDAKTKVTLTIDAFETAGRPGPGPGPTAPVTRPLVLAEPPPAPHERSSVQRPLSYAVLGLGGAALLAGGVVATIAKVRYDGVEDECGGNRCTPSARDTRNGAFDQADVASVLGISGLVVLAAGSVLWLTSRGER